MRKLFVGTLMLVLALAVGGCSKHMPNRTSSIHREKPVATSSMDRKATPSTAAKATESKAATASAPQNHTVKK